MIIANKIILNDYVQRHSGAVKPLNRWLKEVSDAQWQNLHIPEHTRSLSGNL